MTLFISSTLKWFLQLYHNHKRTFLFGLFYILLLQSIILSVTYQQFRHFDISDPRGVGDASYYLKMSHLDFNVNVVARYRPVVPLLAHALSSLFPKLNIYLSFYIINSQITFIASLLLLLICFRVGLSLLPSLLAPIIFLSSRTISIVVGTPHVDPLYFLAISVLFYLFVSRQLRLLLFLIPLLSVTKETLPAFFLFLFFTKMCKPLHVFASFLASVSLSSFVRQYIDHYTLSTSQAAHTASFIQIILSHTSTLLSTTLRLFTPEGLFDLCSVSFGFLTLLLPFAINSHLKGRLPITLNRSVLLVYPTFLFLSFVSGNLGRTFFATFPVTIPLILAYSSPCFPRLRTFINSQKVNPAIP